ncbi:MAG: protein BatD, partial [Candidatus Omnitrophica bacterium]|nr:protein BatD [Candidatus Omnitrophota bacterium]
MKRIFITSLILIVTSVTAWAEAVNFQATVNSNEISMDEVLQLTLTFTGVNQDLNPVSLPNVDGFSAKYLGPSTSVSIVNGVYSSSRSFIYDLFPNKTGHFQIPPITATVNGQTYATMPIEVDVVKNASESQAPASGDQPPGTESLQDRVKVLVSVDQKDVYLNQRVLLTVKLLINNVPTLRDVQMPQFDQQGITVDDFAKPQQYSGVINGVRYDEVVFKTYIYPNRLGDLTLGPVRIRGNVLYKTGGDNNPFDQGVFGDAFKGFFDSYAARSLTVSSQPLVLHVSALSQANRPEDFSGGIGQFDFQASVSPLQVKAGDPLTLKMQLRGNGNFKDVKIPDFQAPGFKSYEPQIKGSENGKAAEEVIIPTSPAVKIVPALHFSYFDPSLKTYKTITQGPFAIKVTAPNPDQQFKAVGFTDISKTPAAADRFSFGQMLGDLFHMFRKLFSFLLFWIISGIILAAGIFYFLWRRFQDRLAHDTAFARRLKAFSQARKILIQAEAVIAGGSPKDFYTLLSKALRDYL